MAIQISGTSVIDNSRNLVNIVSFDNTVTSSYNRVNSTLSNVDLLNRDYYIAASSSLTFTLPASPSPGNEVVVSVYDNVPLTINRNGKNIMSKSENLIIDVNRSTVRLVYVNEASGWVIS
jgi:hypothetical protein